MEADVSAYADDLRYFYSGILGVTQTVAVGAASAKTTALTHGRYLIHYLDLVGTRIWVRQGNQADVVAAAASPSFPMDNDGIRAIEVTVKPGFNGIAAIGAGGTTATLVVTKISRDRS